MVGKVKRRRRRRISDGDRILGGFGIVELRVWGLGLDYRL